MSELFEFDGPRERVNAERAAALVSAAAAKAPNPTKIRLTNKSFDPAAAAVIAEHLVTLSGVVEADLADIIAGLPEEEANKTLQRISSSLKKFDLKVVDVSDNALGPIGIEACKDILTNSALEKLYMCNDGLSAESCVLMSEILLGHGSCATLKVLNFYNNMSGSVGGTAIAEIVKACPVLEDFRFSATRCMAEGCMSLAKAFATRTTLKRVDVSDNSFGAEAAAELAESLKLNVGLEYINLRDDGLSAKGTKAVLKALSEGARSKTSFGKLSVLDLSGNEIDEDIVEALGQTMSSLKTLKQLFLDDNEFGSDGCPVIAKSLKGLSSLETLSCCSCEITAKGAMALARAVAKLPGFKQLELNGNQIFEESIEEIRKVLASAGKTLGSLDDNDEEGEDDLEELEEEEEEEEEVLVVESLDNDNDADALADALCKVAL